MAENREIDMSKITPYQEVMLSRRGRNTEQAFGTGSNIGTGLRMDLQGMIGEAAAQVADKPMLPVINVQKRKGLRLDPRSLGGNKKSMAERMGPKQPPQGQVQLDSPNDEDNRPYSGQERDTNDNINLSGVNLPTGSGELPSAVMSNIGAKAGAKLISGGVSGLLAKALGIPGVNPLMTAIGSAAPSLAGINTANEIAGGVAANMIGDSVRQNASIETLGGPYSSESPEALAAGEKAKLEAYDSGFLSKAAPLGIPTGGLVGMAIRGIGSYLGVSDSAIQAATKGFGTEFEKQKRTQNYEQAVLAGEPVYDDLTAMQMGPSLAELQSPGAANISARQAGVDPLKEQGFFDRVKSWVGSSISNLLSAPDQAAVAGAGVTTTEAGGAYDPSKVETYKEQTGGFNPVQNISNAYQATGVDMFGNPTYGQVSQRDDDSGYKGPTGANAPGGYGTDTYDTDYGSGYSGNIYGGWDYGGGWDSHGGGGGYSTDV